LKKTDVCEYSIFNKVDWRNLNNIDTVNLKAVIIHLTSKDIYSQLEPKEKYEIIKKLKSIKCIVVLVTYRNEYNANDEFLKNFDLYYNLDKTYNVEDTCIYDKVYQLVKERDIYQINLLKSFFSLFVNDESFSIDKMVAEEAKLFCKLVRRKNNYEKRV